MGSEPQAVPTSGPPGRWRTLAYGAYGFLGLVSLWTGALLFPGLEADADTTGAAGVLGFFVALPFGLPAVAAFFVGAFGSVRYRKDRFLLLLLPVTLAVGLTVDSWWYESWPWLLYGAVCCGVAVPYFRRRRVTRAGGRPDAPRLPR